jgi:AraC-like DNA-binding protein
MSILEIMLRGMTTGMVLAIGAGFLRTPRSGGARWAGVIFCVSVAAFALHSGGPETHSLGWLHGPVWLISIAGTAYLWLFGVTLFEDHALSARLLAPAAVMTVVGTIGAATPGAMSRGVWIIHNLLEIVLMVHLALVVWRSWRGDLVEARRSLRGPFMLVVAAYAMLLSGLEIGENLGFAPPWASLVQAATLAVLSLLGASTFLQARDALFGAPARPRATAPDAVGAQDRPALARLRELMDGDEVWRREGLTVGQLAAKVGVPEHRLRRLINGSLGFRNFADFLNARRIEAARSLLSDPAHARLPVSSLAFDLGYASLGPFNRAFKEATGLTPTAWRARALDGSPGS